MQLREEAGAEAAAAARDERAAGHTRGLASVVEFLGLLRLRQWREAYNTARALTDLAETLLAAEEPAAALPLTDEADQDPVRGERRPARGVSAPLA
ncbi:hypothetical protein [Streptomyces anulatus]|uniref:hypothetical protein n=1 Tax=Streptomyces anulatus TaxID=1892 RepID=UPI00386E3ABF